MGEVGEEVFAEVAGSVVVVLALDSSGETQAQGSGVVVGQNEVATNCHVIDEAESVVVRQAADSGGGQTYRMDARVLARDDERDLCLLFVEELSEPPAAPVVEMGAAKGLSVGEEVFAIGAPEGWELSMSRGIVSQLRDFYGKRAAPLVQTDAGHFAGVVGRRVCLMREGELVGITTFKWRGESLNFAIPAEWIGELREKGWVELKPAEKRRECFANPDYECVIVAALFAAAQSIDDAVSRTWALPTIAAAQAKAGDLDGAFATARSINDAKDRALALRRIASAQAEVGDLDGAFATARSIDFAYPRAGALGGIAAAQAKAGDLDGAFATARSIDSAYSRALALRGIAAAQAKAGDLDGAFATARSIDLAYPRAGALRGIAAAQAKAGDLDGAFATARSIDDASVRALALRGIAAAQAEAGDLDGAFATARSIDDADDRAWALRGIAAAQAKTGDLGGAFATARSIDDADVRVWALRDIAAAQAEAGDFRGAIKTAMGIEGYPRASALAVIARHLAARERK